MSWISAVSELDEEVQREVHTAHPEAWDRFQDACEAVEEFENRARGIRYGRIIDPAHPYEQGGTNYKGEPDMFPTVARKLGLLRSARQQAWQRLTALYEARKRERHADYEFLDAEHAEELAATAASLAKAKRAREDFDRRMELR